MQATLVVIITLLLSFWVGLKNPKKIFYTAVVMSPWQGIDVDIGLRVTGFLVLVTGLAGALLVRKVLRKTRTPVKNITPFLGILLYGTVWSMVQIPFLENRFVEGGILRSSELRAISQILMFWLTVSPVLMIPATIENIEELLKIGRFYLVSVVVLATVGWFQIALWVMTGSDPTPIGFFSSLLTGVEEHRSGIMSFNDSIIYRMSSLAGEPKGLACVLVVGLILIQTGLPLKGNKRFWLWIYLFATLVATFSTMGFVIWFIASVAQLLMFTKRNLLLLPDIYIKPSWIVQGILFFMIIIGLIFYTEQGKKITEIIEHRTVGRVQESENGLMEEYNKAVYEYLKDNSWIIITGVGVGNIHLYAYPYLPRETLYYTENSVFVAKSPLLRWVSEMGVITLLILIIWSFIRLRQARNFLSRSKETRAIAGILEIFYPLMMLIWFMGYTTPEFFITLGIVITIPSICR